MSNSAKATAYYWDTNGLAAGSGAATGTWGTSAYWSTVLLGGLLTTNITITSADDVNFSAGTNGTSGTVTINGAQVASSITFDDNVAIILSGGTSITIGGTGIQRGIFVASGDNAANTINTALILNGANTIQNAGGGVLTIGGGITGAGQNLTVDGVGKVAISSAIATTTGTLTKNGAGDLTLSGTNTYTGITSINAGTLVVNGNQSGATGAVSIASIARLMGTGTIGGATTILGTHSAGGSAAAVGTQTFSSSLSYSAGSIFEWDINVSGASETHDKVISNSLGGSGAEFKVLLGSGNSFADTFWNSTHNWTASDLFGVNNANVNLANIFSSANTVANFNANSVDGIFSFTNTGGGTGNQLSWTAVPEPTSALAGVLLAAGLLRRRRV